jgi:hypothetical protein
MTCGCGPLPPFNIYLYFIFGAMWSFWWLLELWGGAYSFRVDPDDGSVCSLGHCTSYHSQEDYGLSNSTSRFILCRPSYSFICIGFRMLIAGVCNNVCLAFSALVKGFSFLVLGSDGCVH